MAFPPAAAFREIHFDRSGDGYMSITSKCDPSNRAPILKSHAVRAKSDEAETLVGLFLVPAGLPGTRIVESWDHLGLRLRRP
jgi:hypothetical protein